jgi:hypothetical protein
VNEQQPWQILSPRDALIEAAKLNREAVARVEAGEQCMAAWVADVAQSLSTYAAAMYRRES